MLLDNARSLKAKLLEKFVPEISLPEMVRTMAIRTQSMSSEFQAMRSFALGISQASEGYRIAVRVQRRVLLDHPMIERIRKVSKGEIDVKYVGRLEKMKKKKAKKTGGHQQLVIGCSIGHEQVTAGTLGCFVSSRIDSATLILSNNHVLANENQAGAGDDILQPGSLDGGTSPDDVAAHLVRFVRLKKSRMNLVDCAVAQPLEEIKFNPRKLGSFGNLKGLGPDFLDEGTLVRKVGRTTGETTGRVTAFEMDNVVVSYDLGNLRFDNQIEIEGQGTGSFSDGGDSGSLIFTEDNLGIGLLFAGGDSGGKNGQGLTYANPLKTVLDQLKVDLVF